MATAAELLAATGDAGDTIVVDLDSRKMSIPETITNLGVMSDDDVKRLYFVVPRYYRNVDLSEFDIRINFKSAAGNGDLYPVPESDIEVDDSTGQIKFSWLIDRTAYEAQGAVTFSMCMVKYDAKGVVEQELNSTTATLNVLAGLETIEAVVENNPSAFDNVLFRLKAVENAMGLGVTGYYNIIDVQVDDEIPTLTIASHDGEIQYTITDGKDGVDGYTPVKGVDYYTEEEKTELETELTNYVDTWAPVTINVDIPASNWIDNQQTVVVEGITKDNLIFVGSEITETNYIAYTAAGIRCVAQADGQLTFSCTKVPGIDVVASVCIYNSNDWPDEDPQTMKEYIDEQIASRLLSTVGDDGNGNVLVSAAAPSETTREMSTLTFNDSTYEVVDVAARESVNTLTVQLEKSPVLIETTFIDNRITMSIPMDDGSTSTHIIALGDDGYPSSITVDGVMIPMTWSVETTSESTTE